MSENNFWNKGWVGSCYNCAGEVIGIKKSNGCLYTLKGKYIGYFNEEGILFNSNGEYLGEFVKIEIDVNNIARTFDSENGSFERMVINKNKVGTVKDSDPLLSGDDTETLLDITQLMKISVPDGYKDFPSK